MTSPVPVAHLRQMNRFQVERKVNALWTAVAPATPSPLRDKLTASFLSRGVSQEDLAQLCERVLSMRREEKKSLSEMISRGFQPEQVALFAQASNDERRVLAGSWLSGAPAHEKVSRVGRGVQTLATIKFGGVATASLLVLLGGLALQNPTLIEVAALTTTLDEVYSKEALEALGAGVERLGLTGTTLAFAGMIYNAAAVLASEVVREPVEGLLISTQRDLEDRVSGVFRRMGLSTLPVPGGFADEATSIKELSAIPGSYLPLLTHFHPKELVVFLSSEEDVRSDMMLRNPPDTEQRILTGRALASGRIREFSGSLQQTLSSWEGSIETTDAVTLGKTMEALRQARQEKRQAGAIPGARPRFGPAAT